MTGMIDNLIRGARQFLTPDMGLIALPVIAVGIAIIVLRVMGKARGLAMLAGIGLLAVAVWVARRNATVLPAIEAPVIDQEKSAFDARFEEARLRPLYEVEVTDTKSGRFTIIRHAIRTDRLEPPDSESEYLVQTFYECSVSNPVRAQCDARIITVYDKQMRVVGKPARSSQRFKFDLRSDESRRFDVAQLGDDLADGTLTLPWEGHSIDERFLELKLYLAEQKRRAADYIKRTKPKG